METFRQFLEADISEPAYHRLLEDARTSKDPGMQRNEKIAKYKEEKSLKQKFMVLRARYNSYGNSVNPKDDVDELPSTDHEDLARELYLKQLWFFIQKTLHAIQGLDMELKMLAETQVLISSNESDSSEQQTEDGRRRSRVEDSSSERLDVPQNSRGGDYTGPLDRRWKSQSPIYNSRFSRGT